MASRLGPVGIAAGAVEACEDWPDDMVPPLELSACSTAVIIIVLGAPFDAVTVAVTPIGVLTLDVTEPDELPRLEFEDCIVDCPDEDEDSERLELWELLEDNSNCPDGEPNDVASDKAPLFEAALDAVEFKKTMPIDEVVTVVKGDILIESETV
jgi:hypothetical protein